jgi:hypothetical protein
MKSRSAGSASVMIEDRDSPRPQGARAPAANKQAPQFQRSGRALGSRVRRAATVLAPAEGLAPELARISDDGHRALALAELDIMAEFLAALDHAKRTIKGPQLAALIAVLRAMQQSKTAAARAAEMGRITAQQGSETRHRRIAHPRGKTAGRGPC